MWHLSVAEAGRPTPRRWRTGFERDSCTSTSRRSHQPIRGPDLVGFCDWLRKAGRFLAFGAGRSIATKPRDDHPGEDRLPSPQQRSGNARKMGQDRDYCQSKQRDRRSEEKAACTDHNSIALLGNVDTGRNGLLHDGHNRAAHDRPHAVPALGDVNRESHLELERVTQHRTFDASSSDELAVRFDGPLWLCSD